MEIIETALELGEISVDDAEALRSICTNASSSITALKDQMKTIERQCLKYDNDIIAAKVSHEKSKLQESDKARELNELEMVRKDATRELESAEQVEIVCRFELQEVKLAYDEVRATLERLKKENLATIGPILDGLQSQVLIDINTLWS